MTKRYIYVGNGEYYNGIPKRDLTDEDLEHLTAYQREIVEGSQFYEAVAEKSRKGAKAQQKDGE